MMMMKKMHSQAPHELADDRITLPASLNNSSSSIWIVHVIDIDVPVIHPMQSQQVESFFRSDVE